MTNPHTHDNLDLAAKAQELADNELAGLLDRTAAKSVAITCATTRDLTEARDALDGVSPTRYGRPHSHSSIALRSKPGDPPRSAATPGGRRHLGVGEYEPMRAGGPIPSAREPSRARSPLTAVLATMERGHAVRPSRWTRRRGSFR